eukprot:GEMP01012914.1.p1 GENE.GEMP01012914.1~~GEMP01012914.1.p1  ORF type:complete len:788 (+),score=180.11 GEMP01012914.1:54-2417(+)
MSDARVFDFSAGPGTTPLQVREDRKENLTNQQGLGMSATEEANRRSKEIAGIAAQVLERSTYLLGPLDHPTVHKSLHHLAHTVKQKNFDEFLHKCGRQTGTSGLLDLPKVQQFDRDITSLQLGTCSEADMPGVQRTYLYTPLMTTVDAAKRKAMDSLYRGISDKMYTDWEVLKGRLMQQFGSRQPGHIGEAPTILALGDTLHSPDAKSQVDQHIFDLLATLDFKTQLASVKKLSCDMCPQYREDLGAIWDLCITLSTSDANDPIALLERSCSFLESQFIAHLHGTLKKAPPELLIGPRSDFHSLAACYGMLFFSDPSFPSTQVHHWFLLYVYVRSGKQITESSIITQGDFALELVCRALEQKDASRAGNGGGANGGRVCGGTGSSVGMGVGLGVENTLAERARVEMTGNGGIFEEFLVAYVNDGALTKWDNWTAQDWLWFQLKQVRDVGGLSMLQQQVSALPASHFESGFYDVQLSLLTFQFSQGLSLLRMHDPVALHSAMIHLAVLLQKSGLLSIKEPGPKLDLPAAFVDYSSQFGLNEQLRRLRVLDLEDRRAALERLMDRPVNATNELLGLLEPDGQFHPGLLEKAFEHAAVPRQEFLLLCEKAGYSALEQGQYREALKLLYNAQRYEKVLTTMTRALRLPLRAAGAGTWDMGLRDELRLFYRVFETQGHALVPNINQNRTWHTVRRLMAVDMFYEKCANAEDALYFFDQQRFFDQLEEDLLTEYPALLSAYVAVLFTSFKSPPRIWPFLRERVSALQLFLASNGSKLSLSRKLQEDLSTLALK